MKWFPVLEEVWFARQFHFSSQQARACNVTVRLDIGVRGELQLWKFGEFISFKKCIILQKSLCSSSVFLGKTIHFHVSYQRKQTCVLIKFPKSWRWTPRLTKWIDRRGTWGSSGFCVARTLPFTCRWVIEVELRSWLSIVDSSFLILKEEEVVLGGKEW